MGNRNRQTDDAAQSTFSFAALVVPQGDGSYLVKPGKPIIGRRKLTVAEAAAKAGLSEDTILRLYDAGFLEGERPSPRKTFIFDDSLDSHLQASRDKEFWEQKRRLQLYLDAI